MQTIKSRKSNDKPAAKSSIRLILSNITLIAIISTNCATAYSSEKELSMSELEVEVWTAPDHKLGEIEKKVAKQMQKNPSSAMAHYLMSKVMIRTLSNNPSEFILVKQASDIAQQAIELEPLSDVGYVALADILDILGDSEKSLALLDEAESNGVESTWLVQFTRARLLADSAGNDVILSYLEKALRSKNTQPKIIVPYIVAVIKADSSSDSHITKLQDWNHRFPSDIFMQAIAMNYADIGKYQKAHEMYKKVYTKKPNNKEAIINDAIVLYKHLDNAIDSEKTFKSVLNAKNNELSKKEAFLIRAHLAAALVKQKKYAEASDVFCKSTKSSGDNDNILKFISKVYRENNSYGEYVKLLQRIADEISGSAMLYALIGETQSEKLGHHRKAIKAFTNAIILDPYRSDYYNGNGLVFYRMKDYEKALLFFAAATKVNPNDATAQYNKACALSLLGKLDESIASLAEAISLDPRLTETAKKDADFVNLQSNSKFVEIVAHPDNIGDPTIGPVVSH